MKSHYRAYAHKSHTYRCYRAPRTAGEHRYHAAYHTTNHEEEGGAEHTQTVVD